MQRVYWLVATTLAVASCGGSPKVEPAPQPGAVAAEASPAAEPQPTLQDTCESLCERVTACATELNPDTPADEEVAQYRSDCLADVCEREDLSRERACLDGQGADCGMFFQCLQEIDSVPAGGDDGLDDDAAAEEAL